MRCRSRASSQPSSYHDGNRGRSLETSTIHADMTAADYATYISVGEDTGYDDPPLQPTQIAVGDRHGELIETDPGEPYTIRRITVEMSPGTLVAVESMGYTVDELIGFADLLAPADLTEPIPLVLAGDGDADQLQGRLYGAIVDGEVCAPSMLWFSGGPHDCTLLGREVVMVVPVDGLPFYAGLVGGDVASITLIYSDGSEESSMSSPPADATRT